MSSQFSQSIWYNPNLNIVFKPNNSCKSVILHFNVNNGAQQNLNMSFDNSQKQYNFGLNGVGKDQLVNYSFTYFPNDSGAVDTAWFNSKAQTQTPNQNNPVAPAPIVSNKSNEKVDYSKPSDSNWIVTFFDDFDGPLNRNIWNVEVTNSGGGNNEAQSYVDRPNTVYTEKGCLILQCNKESDSGKEYTSGRVNTKGKFSTQYGKWEARIKVPKGSPMWCAFWALAAPPHNQWCVDGIEIDIMECVGRSCNKPTGAINFSDKGWPHNRFVYESYEFKDTDASQDFHIYSIIWEPNSIKWFVDGNLYSTKTAEDLKPDLWNCHKPYFIILNNAISGLLGGPISDKDEFPQKMYIDYVKISQWKM